MPAKCPSFWNWLTWSLVYYVVINLFLIAINWFTSPHYWWVLWVIAGWGISLLMTAIEKASNINQSQTKKKKQYGRKKIEWEREFGTHRSNDSEYKNRLETNCGMPFLFWGYTTLFVSLLIWFLVVTTGNYYWQYLWFLLPIIAGTGTYLSTRNQQPGIKTHLDKVINYIWLVFGITGFLISMLAMFSGNFPSCS